MIQTMRTCVSIFGSLFLLAASAFPSELVDGKAAFSVRYRSELTPYRVNGLFVLPGERVEIRVQDESRDAFRATATRGELVSKRRAAWTYFAPGSGGPHRLEIARERDGASVVFNVFVTVPLDRAEGGSLNGFRIGAYPAKPLRGLEIYRPPSGLIEVTEENLDTWVSPHFRLRQFLCKQGGDFPKYVVLQERLLLLLELVLEKSNERGWSANGLYVMSGYRTPAYNEAIGNVPYSRHVWGGAADVFIDESPRDGRMDDLNGDGRADLKDATTFYDFIDGLFRRPFYQRFLGGLGRYDATPAHGPFVHVDVRGTRARWGR